MNIENYGIDSEQQKILDDCLQQAFGPKLSEEQLASFDKSQKVMGFLEPIFSNQKVSMVDFPIEISVEENNLLIHALNHASSVMLDVINEFTVTEVQLLNSLYRGLYTLSPMKIGTDLVPKMKGNAHLLAKIKNVITKVSGEVGYDDIIEKLKNPTITNKIMEEGDVKFLYATWFIAPLSIAQGLGEL